MTLEPGASLVTPFIQQDSLTLHGTAGNPASFSTATLRGHSNGGADSTLRLLSIQTDGGGHALGTFDLADWVQAFKLIEERTVVGKAVLVP